MRFETGNLHRLDAFGATHDEARAAIEKQAELIRFRSVGPMLGKGATIAQACAVFMRDKIAEGPVEDVTLETYQFCIDNVILPQSVLVISGPKSRCRRADPSASFVAERFGACRNMMSIIV